MSRKRGANTAQMRLDGRRMIAQSLRWYAVGTHPGRERAAAMNFVGSGLSVWLPHFRAVTVRRGRKSEISRLFFPGYMFVGFDASSHDIGSISASPHVASILGEPEPLQLPVAVLQAIADRLTGDTRSERLAVAAAFRVGEMRQVVQGPFQSFLATVTELLATGRLKVDVSIFGRATSVELDPEYLDAA